MSFHAAASGKAPACQCRSRRSSFNPWVRKIPGGGHGTPLGHPCLENLNGQRSLVGYIVHGVSESYVTEGTLCICVFSIYF